MKDATQAGAALLNARQFASAERVLDQATQASSDPKAWELLGAARHALGKRAAAIEAFGRALEIEPALSGAACALALVLAEDGRWEEAEAALRKALGAAPSAPQVHFNLAVLLERRSAADEALLHYGRAIEVAGYHEGALLNRGALKMRLGRAEEALEDFDVIVRHNPASADAHVNRNRALLILHRDEEALEAARAALRIAPAAHNARLGEALALASLGRMDEARASMRDTHPDWDADSIFVARALERQDACDWRDRGALLAILRRQLASQDGAASPIGAGLLHRLLALPMSGREILRAASSLASDLKVGAPRVILEGSGDERIRVAIVSAGVSVHPDYFLLRGILKALDRRRFEVILVALNSDDGSPERKEMGVAADRFIDAAAMDSQSIVERLRGERLDLAIDTAGYLLAARPEVFKARVAPVQVAYLGAPATYGHGLMDYRLSDPVATPAATQVDWAEKLVLLPAPHYAYAPPRERVSAGTRGDHGLPPHSFVFCCFNQSFKIDPEAFAIWMRLLRSVAGSTLWLLDEGPRTRRHLTDAAASLGVGSGRLVFAPRVSYDAHLARVGHADLFLDTFHFNAVTTALDTLWAGVPVLTRAGATMTSRLGASIVNAAGLGELVAGSPEEYERVALWLATDPAFLARCKAAAGNRQGNPAFDLGSRVRALERALEALVTRQRAGLPPGMLEIR